MKKIILPFFFLFIALLSCNKENVEKVDEKKRYFENNFTKFKKL
jgi:hypothetical protein